jgi:hypothetical protein
VLDDPLVIDEVAAFGLCSGVYGLTMCCGDCLIGRNSAISYMSLRYRFISGLTVHQRKLSIDDIEALALGAWILGTGGGGSPYHRLLNMRELYRTGHEVTLIDPMSLANNALVAVISNMGAPLVGLERLADPAFATKPVRTMERYLGRTFIQLSMRTPWAAPIRKHR